MPSSSSLILRPGLGFPEQQTEGSCCGDTPVYDHLSIQEIGFRWRAIYLIAFGKPAGNREVAPREFDVHSRWKPVREAEEKRRRRRRKEDEDGLCRKCWL